MLVKKGTTCVAMCCKRTTYKAQFDFTPSEEPLVCGETVYLRGPCFMCLLKTKIAPELREHGITTTTN